MAHKITSNLTDNEKTKLAAEMVILSVIANGHTEKPDLMAYMESDTFKDDIKRYVGYMNE